MSKTGFVRKAGSVAAALLALVFLHASHARGGESGRSGHREITGADPGRSLTLSLRIAEAKGNHAVRTYVRSLLRQKKRHFSLRHNR